MILASVLAALGSCASAATYYVSTAGSDSNPGTQAAPFRHLSKGAAAATKPDDTVIVMDGTYDNEGVRVPNFVVTLYYSGTSGHPITFMAQNRGKAILDSGNTSSSSCNGAASYWNLYNASFIVIQGFVIQNACDSGFQSNNSAHDIVIRQNEVRYIGNWYITDQIGRDGIYINKSEYNFTFDGNIWHDIGRLGGNTLHFDHGIYSHASNLTIINNVFYNMKAGWSIQFADGANNYLIANNTFAFANTGNGQSGQVMWWGNNTNMTFRNNIFYNPTNSAMTQYAATISGCVFDHNLVYPVSSVMNGSFPCSVTSNLTGSSANPQFVNASANNFYTQPGGAGVDAGVNLSAVPYDYAGTTRPQGSSTDMGAYEYLGSGSTNTPVISGVFTSGISTNSAVVNWSTDQPSTSYVQYGLTSYTNTTATDSTLMTSHSMPLSGLSASTLYHFRAASTNSSGQTTFSSDSTFTTAAPVTTSTTLALSSALQALSVVQGNSVTDGITATLVSGNPASVSFSASSLPAGVSAGFSPSSCTATCSTTLTLSISAMASPGTYNIVVTGTGPNNAPSATIPLTITASGSWNSPDITTGMAARWKFTEGSGSYAYDSSGNGNTATLHSPTWWTSNYGMTAWFSGSRSYGSVNESASLKMTNELTVAFWLRPSTNSNTDPRVISKMYDWDVKLNGSNRYPQFSVGGQYATLSYALPLITWHHVVFTFSNGVVKGYVDGVQVPFSANTFTATSLPNWAYGLYLATYDSSLSNPYIGSLDDVRLYNRALSSTDVAALYQVLPRLN